jgi:hypothetical protein
LWDLFVASHIFFIAGCLFSVPIRKMKARKAPETDPFASLEDISERLPADFIIVVKELIQKAQISEKLLRFRLDLEAPGVGVSVASHCFSFYLIILTVCPSVASRNPLLYQSLPIIIPYQYVLLRRRKDDASVGTTASGTVA